MNNKLCGNNSSYNAAHFTKDDFKSARQSWRRNICGDEIINNRDDNGIKNLLDMIDVDSLSLRMSMNRQLDSPMLFGDEKPTESGELKPQYDRLFRLALPFGTFGCAGYRDTKILEDVLLGLEILYRNMYGENVLSDSSYRSYKLYDWWDWYAGAAHPLLDVLMIIAEDISKEEILKYTLPVSFLRTQMRTENAPFAAMSRLPTLLPLALLTEDKAMLQSLYLDTETLLMEYDEGDNMRRDWCCMTHAMPYNVAYGSLNMSRVAKSIKVLEGTPLAFNMKNKYNLMNMARYCYAPVMYKGKVFCAMNGRAIQRDDSALQLLENFHYLIGIFGDDEDKELKEMIFRNYSSEVKQGLLSSFDVGITLNEYRKINSIPPRFSEAPKTSVTAYSIYKDALVDAQFDLSPYTIGYMWYSGDTAVQFRNDCMVGLRMCSKRTPGYECTNNENQDGWYTGDGALYLYTPKCSEQFSPKWWKNADKHLIPGTTADSRQRIPMSYYEAYKNSMSFVGGVALNREFVAATMDYEAFHNEKDESHIDNGYGRGWPVHISTLNAHKSYFFFDRVIVALGTNINANDGFSVRTVVENCMMSENNSVFINGESVDISLGEQKHTNIHSIHISGRGTYFFFNAPLVTVKKYKNEEVTYISFWIEHGINPSKETYAYAILPNCTKEESEKYSLDDIELISFKDEIHCVRERSSAISAIVFRTPSEILGFKANQSMVVMMKEEKDNVSVSVSEPTGEKDVFSFDINHCTKVINAESDIEYTFDNGRASFCVNCDSAKGRGYSFRYKK